MAAASGSRACRTISTYRLAALVIAAVFPDFNAAAETNSPHPPLDGIGDKDF